MFKPIALAEADCTFCDILVEPATAFDVGEPIGEDGLTVVPSLGMIVPGYLLALTDKHLTSFAQLSLEELGRMDAAVTEVESQLSPLFGNYFRMEHGSDNLDQCGSGGCMEHAHLHLIPADDDVGVHIQDQLPWQQIGSYEDLADFEGEPYIYLGRLASHYVLPNPFLPGQWARRKIAEVRQLESFDWALDPEPQNLAETFARIQTLPAGFENFKNHTLVNDHLATHLRSATEA